MREGSVVSEGLEGEQQMVQRRTAVNHTVTRIPEGVDMRSQKKAGF